jgi:hypothetical protein
MEEFWNIQGVWCRYFVHECRFTRSRQKYKMCDLWQSAEFQTSWGGQIRMFVRMHVHIISWKGSNRANIDGKRTNGTTVYAMESVG